MSITENKNVKNSVMDVDVDRSMHSTHAIKYESRWGEIKHTIRLSEEVRKGLTRVSSLTSRLGTIVTVPSAETRHLSSQLPADDYLL